MPQAPDEQLAQRLLRTQARAGGHGFEWSEPTTTVQPSPSSAKSERLAGLQRHQRARAHGPGLQGGDLHGVAVWLAMLAQVLIGVVKHRHGANRLQRLAAGAMP